MFYEKVFLESLANLQENACTRVSFLNMVASCRGFQKKKKDCCGILFNLSQLSVESLFTVTENIAQSKS